MSTGGPPGSWMELLAWTAAARKRTASIPAVQHHRAAASTATGPIDTGYACSIQRQKRMATFRTFLAMATLCGAAALAQGAAMITFDFEADTPGNPPRGFLLALTGKGRPGHWVVVAADDAPSGRNVLAQEDGDTTDYRFPIAFTGPELRDLRLSVRCKAVAGKGDQGCGLIWRVK